MASISPAPNVIPSLRSLALFRILFGLMYLHMARTKAPWVVTDGHHFGWLYGWIEKEIASPTLDVYAAFLRAVVLPHFTIVGLVTFLVEAALGLALVLGLFVPLAGTLGALWTVNIAMGSYSVPGEWGWIWVLLIMPQIVFALCRAGRPLGLDAVVARLLANRFAAGKTLPPWTRYLA
jgi:hypothetical protein